MSKEMRNYIDTFKKFNLNENKNDDFKEYDIVVLKRDIDGISKGTRGAIVFDYESGGMYEVEFFDDEHNTIDVIRVFKGDLKQFVNENEYNDFILNNDNVKTYTWTSGGKEHTIKYHLSRDIFKGLYDAVLLGGEFANTYGHGETEKDAVESLKLRVIQLRNKRDGKNF